MNRECNGFARSLGIGLDARIDIFLTRPIEQ
jgi:hypothetical protein